MSGHLVVPAPPAQRVSLPAQARWTRRVALGTHLRNARLAARLTVAELADGLTSAAYLSRIEAAERRPSQELLNEFARRLDVHPDELSRGESPAAEGLRFELAHADHLMASGQIEDAIWVSRDLAEVAKGIGAVEVADAALVVHATALAAQGHHHAALRIVRPLVAGPVGLLAMVAAARFHVALSNFDQAIRVGQCAVDQASANERLSFPESADLAISMCEAAMGTGDDRTAGRIARVALRYLPKTDTLGSDQELKSAARPISYRSMQQAVRRAEIAVAELQDAKLHDDIARLRTYAVPSARRAARAADSTVRAIR